MDRKQSPRLPQLKDKPRALVIFTAQLDAVNGFSNYSHSFGRYLKSLGIAVDLVCFSNNSIQIPKDYRGIYENIYYPQSEVDAFRASYEALRFACSSFSPGAKNSSWSHQLMLAAQLANLRPYKFVVVHQIYHQWIKYFLPPHCKLVLFTLWFNAVLNGGIHNHSAAEIAANLKPELEECTGYDIITATGHNDALALAAAQPETTVCEFPHTLTPVTPARLRAKADELLFLGYNNPGNAKSLTWFVEEVWPTLRKIRPSVHLNIVGFISLYAESRGYDAIEGISVRGVVNDLKPYFDKSDIILALVMCGEGIKTRIIEGLNQGIPVATNTLGLTNTRLKANKEVIVSDDGATMAKLLDSALSSLPRRHALQKNGLAYLKKHHTFDCASMQPLTKAITKITHGAPKQKRKGITGPPPPKSVGEGLNFMVPWVVKLLKAKGIRRVALYGAGSHTNILMPLWKKANGPEIIAILSTTPPTTELYNGIPCQEAAKFQPEPGDAIVASSHAYELLFAKICRKLHPKTPFFKLWTA